MKKKYYIVMHTHWDREWYFRKDETKILLRNQMIEIIEFLEENNDIIYMLDGQYVMIDDFLEVESNYTDRLINLIDKNQLIIGPWYTQTDLLLPNQESILRNLYYGITKSRKLTNKPLLVGYAPDTFGHNAQMPQIYQLFDINYSVFWRGISKELTENGIFIWESLDGSRVTAFPLISGYQGAKYLPIDEAELKERIETIEKKYNNYNITEHILLMNGHDQMPIQQDIKSIVKSLDKMGKTSKIINLIDYCRETQHEIEKKSVVSGDLDHAEFARVHRTINTTRMDIKWLNYEVERKLYNILEPLSIVATKIGIDYPVDIIEKVLLILFGVHPHDSLGGCNSDEVNEDILARLKEAESLVDNHIELLNRLITESNEEGDVTLINTLPYTRKNQLVEMTIHTKEKDFSIVNNSGDEISYCLLEQNLQDMAEIDRQVLARREDIKRYKSKVSFLVEEIRGLSTITLNVIERTSKSLKLSEELNIEIENNNIFFYKEKEKLVGINIFSEGDDGDGYDFSPLKNDSMGRIQFDIHEIKKENHNLFIRLIADLPLNLEKRELKESGNKYYINLIISENNDYFTLDINFENNVYDHQLSVKFITDTINNVKSDLQFGEVARINNYELLDEWEDKKWVERPVNSHKFQNYLIVNDNLVIFNNTTKAFTFEKNIIEVPIFRSFSYLGKPDLVNRPGRASGMHVLTPKNRMLGKEMRHRFYILKRLPKNVGKISKEIYSPVQATQIKEYNKFNLNKKYRPNDFKDFNLNIMSEIVVSSCKLSELNKEIFIRGYNASNETKTIVDREGFYLSNVYEEKLGQKIYELEVQPQKIVNIIKEKK